MVDFRIPVTSKFRLTIGLRLLLHVFQSHIENVIQLPPRMGPCPSAMSKISNSLAGDQGSCHQPSGDSDNGRPKDGGDSLGLPSSASDNFVPDFLYNN